MRRSTVTALAAAFAVTAPALAHHGWTWADEQQTELTGVVDAVDMAPPHPRLTVTTADDGQWTVELGNPTQTEKAGFTADSAKPGDSIVALGNRATNGDKRLKAVRVTIGDTVYTPYPERVQE
jgi:hypothetical protein